MLIVGWLGTGLLVVLSGILLVTSLPGA